MTAPLDSKVVALLEAKERLTSECWVNRNPYDRLGDLGERHCLATALGDYDCTSLRAAPSAEVLLNAINSRTGSTWKSITLFNDYPGRTLEEIHQAIDWALEDLGIHTPARGTPQQRAGINRTSCLVSGSARVAARKSEVPVLGLRPKLGLPA